MLEIEALKNLLHQPGFSKTDKLLLCASLKVKTPKSVAEIKEIAKQSGFRQTDKWNVSSLLSKSGGLAIRTDDGWELTDSGKERVAMLAGTFITNSSPKIASSLRSHLSSITNHETAAFLEEAIRCYETKLYRSAVVLTWVGAISLFYDYVVTHKLVAGEFRNEVQF